MCLQLSRWWVPVLEGVLLLEAGWGHGYAWAGLPPGLSGPVAWPAVCFLLCKVGCWGDHRASRGAGAAPPSRGQGWKVVKEEGLLGSPGKFGSFFAACQDHGEGQNFDGEGRGDSGYRRSWGLCFQGSQ